MVIGQWHRSWLLRLTLLVCVSAEVAAAEITPRITISREEEPVYWGDSVVIELESVGLDAPPDTSALFKEADLLRETIGTRIAVINQQVVEIKLRRMELLPRRQGVIILGPLSGSSVLEQVTSNSISIDVQAPADTQWQPTASDVHIAVSVSLGSQQDTAEPQEHTESVLPSPYVGQHIVATIELKHSHPIADEHITLPRFEGFDVLAQFTERRTIDELDDGSSQRVTTWQYHLFARHSGALHIGSVHWRGTAIRSRTMRAGFERVSAPVPLHIKPATQSVDWWLPAAQVRLAEHWSKDPRELSAGDEIIRTITLTAQGVLANHLPDIVPLESRALSTTPVHQSRSQQLTEDQLMATAVFKFRMIAQSPIPVFLDTVRVPWFSTSSDTGQEAIIPARRINVGLPDRADLLASLALEGRWIDRAMLRVSGSFAQWLPWHALLVLLSLIAAALWIRELLHWRTERLARRKGLPSGVLPEL